MHHPDAEVGVFLLSKKRSIEEARGATPLGEIESCSLVHLPSQTRPTIHPPSASIVEEHPFHGEEGARMVDLLEIVQQSVVPPRASLLQLESQNHIFLDDGSTSKQCTSQYS